MTSLSKLIPSARGLLMFEAAARHGSFTAAAAEFNVAQPSVSRSVAQLEAALGLMLFRRSPTGLQLSAEGAEIYGVVRESLGRIEETIRIVKDRHKTTKPIVTLSMSSSFVTTWLVPRLRDFYASFPSVDLRFDLVPGALGSVPENIDLATRVIADDDPSFYWWDFAPEIIIPVCSPSYLRDHGPLDHEGNGDGHVFLHLIEHDLKQWGPVWGNAANRGAAKGTWLEFSDYAVILQAAVNGEGVALGWVSVISSAVLRGTLVPASKRQIHTGRYHRLIAPKSRPLRPVVEDIRNWLVEQMDKELRTIQPLLEHPSGVTDVRD